MHIKTKVTVYDGKMSGNNHTRGVIFMLAHPMIPDSLSDWNVITKVCSDSNELLGVTSNVTVASPFGGTHLQVGGSR